MQNINTQELNGLSSSFFSLIGGCVYPGLTASAGLAGLVLTPICTDILYKLSLQIILPTTVSLDFALWMTSFLITTHVFGQAFFPLLIAPFVGFGVCTAILIGLGLLAAGFNQLYNSISSCLNP